jgi:hypothetical protein
MIGEVFTYREAHCGYWMVMARRNSRVIVSPLFWRDREWPTRQFSLRAFKEAFRLVTKAEIQYLHPVVQARYDRECLRLWRTIAWNTAQAVR